MSEADEFTMCQTCGMHYDPAEDTHTTADCIALLQQIAMLHARTAKRLSEENARLKAALDEDVNARMAVDVTRRLETVEARFGRLVEIRDAAVRLLHTLGSYDGNLADEVAELERLIRSDVEARETERGAR